MYDGIVIGTKGIYRQWFEQLAQLSDRLDASIAYHVPKTSFFLGQYA
jgi:hypothetical protein